MTPDPTAETASETAAAAPADVDVLIVGGGLAGLTLARQLHLEHPEVSVAILDRLARPLPEAAFKVGESTVELASYYLREVVDLAEHLDAEHLRKMGIRMFFTPGDGGEPLQARPEFGLSHFASVPTHQIDRGTLEQHLRDLVEAEGARLIEGARVMSIETGAGDAPHEVTYYLDGNPELQHIRGRWIVDAAGRSRMLQNKLGLANRRSGDHNAAWFRLDGKLDLTDLVPADDKAWHDRVPAHDRWYSTNHLVGEGYWVWVIGLPGDRTSVGIVALKDVHPFETFSKLDRAKAWLAKNEPVFAARMEQLEVMDFSALRSYTHTSHRVFSADRWACTGDSGVFADPLYSPGSDLIAFSNTCISWLVGEDLAGRLTPEMAEEKSRFIISLSELLTRSIQTNYRILGAPGPMGAKLFWDFTAGWAVVQPLMFGKCFLDPAKHAAFRAPGRQFFFLSLQMNQMFLDWAAKSQGKVGYDFIDYLAVDAIREMRDRNLVPDKPLEQIVADQEENIRLMEELALAIFRVAVADVCPEALPRIEGKWLNAWAVSLDPASWEERGLFKPRSEPRDTSHLTEQIGAAFGLAQQASAEVAAAEG